MTPEQIAAHCARIDAAVAREAAAYRAVQAARKARAMTEAEWDAQTAAEEAEFSDDDGYPLDDWGDKLGISWTDDRGEPFSRGVGLERRS